MPTRSCLYKVILLERVSTDTEQVVYIDAITTGVS
jgi:hypothetical protein